MLGDGVLCWDVGSGVVGDMKACGSDELVRRWNETHAMILERALPLWKTWVKHYYSHSEWVAEDIDIDPGSSSGIGVSGTVQLGCKCCSETAYLVLSPEMLDMTPGEYENLLTRRDDERKASEKKKLDAERRQRKLDDAEQGRKLYEELKKIYETDDDTRD